MAENRQRAHKYWLHRIVKSDTCACQCGHHTKDGRQITFDCPDFGDQGAALGNIKDWEDLDCPIWIQEVDRGEWDAVEAFFSFLYRQMAGEWPLRILVVSLSVSGSV